MNWEACKSFWPNAEHSRFVHSGPHVWHVQEMGSGPDLLLIHGAGASTHTWRDVLPRLARNFRAMAIDLPGQGFTRLGARGRCGLQEMSADIASLLEDQRIIPEAIVGHSAGGAIALRLALDLPVPPVAVVGINAALRNFRGPAAIVFPAAAKLLSMIPGTARAFCWTASSESRVRRLIDSTGSHLDAYGIGLYRLLLSDRDHVAATLNMMAQWDLAPLLSDLPANVIPTLLLVGCHDRAIPPETGERTAGLIANSKLMRFPLGHLLHEEDSGEAALAIQEWLSSL